ncbi:hypothetical protein BDN70DRAFT_887519, partial [Pholiota conissans]
MALQWDRGVDKASRTATDGIDASVETPGIWTEWACRRRFSKQPWLRRCGGFDMLNIAF